MAQMQPNQPKQNFYLIEENLLRACMSLMEELPIRMNSSVVPIIQALRQCPLVNVNQDAGQNKKEDTPVIPINKEKGDKK